MPDTDIAPVPQAQHQTPPPNGPQLRPGIVLAVDPDPAVRRVIGLVLEELGFVTHGVADAESALEILPGLNPDLVVAEVRLPGMSGVTLVETIRAMGLPKPHVLLMSAYPRPRPAGEGEFMRKPLRFERLLEVAKESLPI